MNLGSIAAMKVMGGGVGALALAGSGSCLATLLRENEEIIREETNIPEQEQKPNGKDRYTKLTEIEGTKLFLEYSHIDGQKPYIKDYLFDQTVSSIYYIVNSKNKNIRVSLEKPPKEHKGIYRTWVLHEFKHSEFKSSLYGYCPPEEITEDVYRVCDHLPEGWTKVPVE